MLVEFLTTVQIHTNHATPPLGGFGTKRSLLQFIQGPKYTRARQSVEEERAIERSLQFEKKRGEQMQHMLFLGSSHNIRIPHSLAGRASERTGHNENAEHPHKYQERRAVYSSSPAVRNTVSISYICNTYIQNGRIGTRDLPAPPPAWNLAIFASIRSLRCA